MTTLDLEQVLKFCIKNRMTINEFFTLYMLARRDFDQSDSRSLSRQYLARCGKMDVAVIDSLVNKGYLEDMNSPGEFYPMMMMLKPLADKIFVETEMASEIWDKYPATFPLNGKGSSFLARAGGDKDEIVELYLKKINYSLVKHQFVMEQLGRYIEMVKRGELNGHKIGDWIRAEMWDTVAATNQQTTDYGRDI